MTGHIQKPEKAGNAQMAFKRALWTSGYEYRARCPYCGNGISYTDRQLDFRPWYPNGFVYCGVCRKPLRHSEIFAVDESGAPVYSTVAEAEAALTSGYYKSLGYNAGQQGQGGTAASPSPERAAGGSEGEGGSAASGGFAFCPDCGNKYKVGEASFCARCGRRLAEGTKMQ